MSGAEAERVSLRRATLADVEAMTRLIDASVRSLSVGYYRDDVIEESLVSVFGIDTQLIEDGTYFVVDAPDGSLAAIGGWSRRRTLYGGDQTKRDEDPLLDPALDAARIRAFFVHPDWSRRGLATMLFAACSRAARDAGFRRFALGATLPGVPLYRRLGFAEVSRTQHQMRHGLTLEVVTMQTDIPMSEDRGDALTA
jgi:GNAT superfamily N-acetyltransferase